MERLVWARNPDNYIREALEVGQERFVFDKGRLVKRAMNVTAFFDLYYGVQPWQCLVIDGGTKTAMHLDNEHPETNPLAVYPVWEFGDNIQTLDKLMREPWGENTAKCFNGNTHVSERPKIGQPHIVVIQNLPNAGHRNGKQFYQLLAWMQSEMPHCIIHIHGSYSFKVMYSMRFPSTDFDPRNDAGLGYCTLPTGIKKRPEQLGGSTHWTDLFSLRPIELKVPRNRCMFNIKSHNWAANYFTEALRIDTVKRDDVDPDAIDPAPRENDRIFVSNKQAEEGDKFYCDLCSLRDSCKFFRQGQVCIVPGSDAVELAALFKTRNSDDIIEGLGDLMAVQTSRLGDALAKEQEDETTNPEVTKIINSLFDRGVKLAKLVNPALAKPAVQVNLTNNNAGVAIQGATPQALVAGFVAEFQRRGISAEDITPEMLSGILTNPDEVKANAIEVAGAERANG